MLSVQRQWALPEMYLPPIGPIIHRLPSRPTWTMQESALSGSGPLVNSPATSAAKPSSDHPQPVDAPENRMIKRGEESTSSVVENQTMPNDDESTSQLWNDRQCPRMISTAYQLTLRFTCLILYGEGLDGISFKCAIHAAYKGLSSGGKTSSRFHLERLVKLSFAN